MSKKHPALWLTGLLIAGFLTMLIVWKRTASTIPPGRTAPIYFTSMGSLGIRPVYHRLYDFGTVPAFCALGRKRRAEEIKDGHIVGHK